MNDPTWQESASELKAAFDGAFAVPLESDPESHDDLLVVRANAEQLALYTRDIAGVLRCPPLTPAPSANEAFVGLTAVRASMVTVFSIAALRGHPHEPGARGWLALCQADRSLALWFDELVAFERVRNERSRISGFVTLQGRSIPTMDVSEALKVMEQWG